MKNLLSFILSLVILTSVQAQWEPIGGPYGGAITDIIQSNGDLFVRSSLKYYKHAPATNSWKKLTGDDRNGYYADHIAQQEDVLLAVFTDYYNPYPVYEIRKSEDEGASWEEVGFPATTKINALVSNAFGFYLSTAEGIYYSIDDGATWTPSEINNTLPSITGPMYAYDGQVFLSDGGVVYHSASDTDAWTFTDITGNDADYNLYVFDSVYLAVGLQTQDLFRSGNAGQTWTPAGSQKWPNSNFIKMGDTYYGHTGGYVYESADHGNTFQLVSPNQIQEISKIMPLNDHLLIGAKKGLLRSDENLSQNSFYIQDLDASWVNRMRYDKPSFLMAVVGIGIVRMEIESGMDHEILLEHETIHDVIESSGKMFATQGTDHLVTSEDGGLSWTEYTQSEFTGLPLYHLFQDQQAIYVYGQLEEDARMYRYDLSGAGAWELFTIDEIAPGISPVAMHQHGEFVFAVYPDKIARWSPQSGWQVVSQENEPYSRILRFTVGDDVLGYFYYNPQTYFTTFKISVDGGQQWTPVPTSSVTPSLEEGGFINAFFAGSSIIGYWNHQSENMYITHDFGITWEPFNEGLSFAEITGFASDEEYIYAASFGRGIYRRSVEDIQTSSVSPDALSKSTLTIYPNPSNGEFYLDIANATTDGMVIISDAMGRTLYQLNVNGPEANRIRMPDMSNGIFFVSLVTGTHTLTGKVFIYGE